MPGYHNQDFASLASGGDIAVTLVDNSADFTNSILKWAKLTLRWTWEPTDMSVFEPRDLLVGIIKRDQDSSAVPSLDSEEAIRELRNDKKLVRGPWIITTPRINTSGFVPPMMSLMKPIVLKNFVMDREEDLLITFTNVNASAFSATSQVVKIWPQGFVRVIK